MGRLFDLIDAHRDAQRYPPSYAAIASKVGVSRQTLLNWRTPTKLIEKKHIEKLAREIHVSYRTVLDALLEDIGYLHTELDKQKAGSGDAAFAAEKSPDDDGDVGGAGNVTPLRPNQPDAAGGVAAEGPDPAGVEAADRTGEESEGERLRREQDEAGEAGLADRDNEP